MSRPWFENLTPHEVVLYVEGGRRVHLKRSSRPARVEVTQQVVGTSAGLKIVENTYGNVVGLPEQRKGVVYIVSLIVRKALGASRLDVVAPDTGTGAVRADNGRLIGVTRLIGPCLEEAS